MTASSSGLLLTLIILCLFISGGVCVNWWQLIFGHQLIVNNGNERTSYSNSNSPSSILNQRITEKLVRRYGYRIDTHLVASETGHILTLHRIINKEQRKRSSRTINENNNGTRPIALIHHGLLGCSDMWLIRGPQYDLPYLLTDAGYDVWLFNIRGNVHSRRHKMLNPDTDPKYWDFGIEEIGYYDLPATIDYILNITNKNNIYFLGHSIGSSSALIMCSLRPEYNNKIKLFLALGPLANVKHEISLWHKIVFLAGSTVIDSLHSDNILEIFPRRLLASKVLELLCRNGSLTENLCLQLIFTMVGPDHPQFDTHVLGNFVQYYPSGTSIKLLANVLQYYMTGNFARFNFGAEANLLHYNSTAPPLYNLKKVTAPVAIFYGEGDFLVTEEDVDHLANNLPNIVQKFKIPHQNFNHLDFVLAINSSTILYQDILITMNKYR